MEYQRIAAACFFPYPVRWWVVLRDCLCLERCGLGVGGLVFGTLLGPEATGPVRMRWNPCGVVVCFVGFVCFWFPGCTDHAFFVCGVCGLGLLFENYIVDASIFYKKQFPRI